MKEKRDYPISPDVAMSFDEIGRELGITASTAWTLYKTGMRKLKEGVRRAHLERIRANAQAKEQVEL